MKRPSTQKKSLVCEECGASFDRFESQLREHNYCSRDCSDRAKREKTVKSKEALLSNRMVVTSFTLDNESLRTLDEIGNFRSENRSETIRRLIKSCKDE